MDGFIKEKKKNRKKHKKKKFKFLGVIFKRCSRKREKCFYLKKKGRVGGKKK